MASHKVSSGYTGLKAGASTERRRSAPARRVACFTWDRCRPEGLRSSFPLDPALRPALRDCVLGYPVAPSGLFFRRLVPPSKNQSVFRNSLLKRWALICGYPGPNPRSSISVINGRSRLFASGRRVLAQDYNS